MTQNDKELLLKDLCCRLPYGVLIQEDYTIDDEMFLPIAETDRLVDIDVDAELLKTNGGSVYHVDEIKSYLFPLSSMTEEQWMDTPYANLNNFTFDSFKCGCSSLAFETYEVNLRYVVDFINWCYKNHFDVNGLIPKGLAIDATNLKIY